MNLGNRNGHADLTAVQDILLSLLPRQLGQVSYVFCHSVIHTADRIFSPQFNLDDGKVRNCREEHFFLLGYYYALPEN